MAHYGRRAEAAGLTLEKQLRYELEVNHGFTLPDSGDGEATRRGQLFRRMYQERILLGSDAGSAMNSKQFRQPADGYTRTTRVGGRIFGGRGFRLMSKIGPLHQRNVYARIYRPRGGRSPFNNTAALGVVVVQDFDGVAVEDGDDGAGGSHTPKPHGTRFIIESGAISLRSVSLFTVYL